MSTTVGHGSESYQDAVSLTNNKPSGDTLFTVLGTSCPQDEDSCVFVCVSAGFRTEAYRSYVLFVTGRIFREGDAIVTCSKSLEGRTMPRPRLRVGPVLLGTFRGLG
eukprot:1907559-Rhodomonas_salina.3